MLSLINIMAAILSFLLVFLLFINASIWILLLNQFVVMIISTWVLIKASKGIEIFRVRRDEAFIKKSLSYGIRVHLSNIITYFHYKVDLMLINMFLNPLFVGYYSLAVNISEKTWMLSQSMSSVLFSRISNLGDEHKKNIVIRLSVIFTFWASLAVMSILVIWGGKIIPFVYGEAYLPAFRLIQILSVGIIMLSISRLLSSDIAGRGYPQKTIIPKTISLIINVILNIILIPRIGVSGAALSTTLTYAFSTIFVIIIHWKVTGIKPISLIIPNSGDILLGKMLLKERREK